MASKLAMCLCILDLHSELMFNVFVLFKNLKAIRLLCDIRGLTYKQMIYERTIKACKKKKKKVTKRIYNNDNYDTTTLWIRNGIIDYQRAIGPAYAKMINNNKLAESA